MLHGEAKEIMHRASANEKRSARFQLAPPQSAIQQSAHCSGRGATMHLQQSNLASMVSVENISNTYELVDFRMIAPVFRSGSIPLSIISQACEEIQKMLGYAALRFTQGGIDRKRVPKEVYEGLDLRLAGILPGSSRLLIAAAAHRGLFDDGIAKHSIQRIFSVLESEGHGEDFLEAVMDLGPSSARKLRDFLRIIRSHSAELELTWSYVGQQVHHWKGNHVVICKVTQALENDQLKNQSTLLVRGVIEMLSKRERIHLRSDTGELLRILFSKKLFGPVTELHLDQSVSLRCQVTETENTITKESSTYYELIDVVG
ncbi:MAG: hypothetical protein NT163_11055 [Chlorobiales bacterium]|nr:hypothetical protein [Chlorobiales bacterium]